MMAIFQFLLSLLMVVLITMLCCFLIKEIFVGTGQNTCEVDDPDEDFDDYQDYVEYHRHHD